MGLVNQAKVDAAQKSFNTIFKDSMRDLGDDTLINALMMTVNSEGQSETYNWFGDFIKMREWIGERRLADMKAYDHTIHNKKFEATLKVEVEDFEDDRLGVYEPRIRQLPNSYDRKRRKDMIGLLEDGDTDTGYDGVAFFSDSHPNDTGANQSNVQTGFALNGTNFDTAVENMNLLKDDDGEYLDVDPDTLVIGPKQRATARDLFSVPTLSDGSTNPYFNAIERIVVEKRLGTSTDWYLFDTSHELKPFIFQDRVAPQFNSVTDANSEYVFNNDAFLFGIRARYGMGYALWQLAFKASE